MVKGFRDYQPTKTQAFWFGVICIVATVVLGFTWGGWMTQGVAAQKADEAADKARVQLGAALCVEEFKRTAGANDRLQKLKDKNTYMRDDMVRDEGFATLPGESSANREVANVCAERLAKLERIPQSKSAEQTAAAEETEGETAVQ